MDEELLEIEIEDRFEDLYSYNLFELMDENDLDLCDRSRTELEMNEKLKKILGR